MVMGSVVVADPFKLSVCLSFPATRTQLLAGGRGEGVKKGTVGLVLDSWDEKATGIDRRPSQADRHNTATTTRHQLLVAPQLEPFSPHNTRACVRACVCVCVCVCCI